MDENTSDQIGKHKRGLTYARTGDERSWVGVIATSMRFTDVTSNRVDADLTHNQAVVDLLGSKEKLRRYQSNPANWGPLAKPNSGPQNTKNSSEEHANDNATSDDVDIHKSKKAKIDM